MQWPVQWPVLTFMTLQYHSSSLSTESMWRLPPPSTHEGWTHIVSTRLYCGPISLSRCDKQSVSDGKIGVFRLDVWRHQCNRWTKNSIGNLVVNQLFWSSHSLIASMSRVLVTSTPIHIFFRIYECHVCTEWPHSVVVVETNWKFLYFLYIKIFVLIYL